MTFEPRIVGILCNWCSYTGADLAGTARVKYAPNVRVVRVMCSGRVDPTFILKAFASGADGVLVAGCHPGDCHYIEGNYKTMRRMALLKRMLADYGVEPGRFRLEWVSASEGERWGHVVNTFTEEVRALGPARVRPPDGRRRVLPQHASAAPEPLVPEALKQQPASAPQPEKRKLRIAQYWASGCGGCDTATLDLHEKILDVAALADIAFWPIAVDTKYADLEAMPDGFIDVTLFNGAVRNSENEHLAKLLRAKSKVLVAFGSCAYLGGIPSLANLFNRELIFKRVYHDSPSTANPEGTEPQPRWEAPEGELTLPEFHDTVRALDRVVEVDYYVPGCPPDPTQIWNVLQAVATGNLPAKGAVIGAGDKAQCDECKRTKNEKKIAGFKRIATAQPDPDTCFLEQGFLCLGLATRSGCGTRCQNSGVGCRGCYGPPPGVVDQGAKALSAIASVIEAKDDAEVARIVAQIPDLLRSLNRFGIAGSLLERRTL